MQVKVVFDERFLQVYTRDPAAAQGRLDGVLASVGERGFELVPTPPVDLESIAQVHGQEHIAWVQKEGLLGIAMLACSAATHAARLSLTAPAFALVRPPGHHASRDSSWGFCYLNNLAVALSTLKREQLIQRAMVLDIDLHYGDGTVNILGRKDWVEIHNFDAESRGTYLKYVQAALDDTHADMLAISAGFDYHQEDWGGLLATEDYRLIGSMTAEAARAKGASVFGVLEGGYNHALLGQNVSALLEGLEEGWNRTPPTPQRT